MIYASALIILNWKCSLAPTNEVRQEFEVDVLYKTTIDNEETSVYFLIEHQSKPDPLMPFRLLKYKCIVMDAHLKNHKTKKLPLIYPLMVYHGVSEYAFSTHFDDRVDAPKELIEKNFLKSFQLIDLARANDETLMQHAWSGVMEFALKHIF